MAASGKNSRSKRNSMVYAFSFNAMVTEPKLRVNDYAVFSGFKCRAATDFSKSKRLLVWKNNQRGAPVIHVSYHSARLIEVFGARVAENVSGVTNFKLPTIKVHADFEIVADPEILLKMFASVVAPTYMEHSAICKLNAKVPHDAV